MQIFFYRNLKFKSLRILLAISRRKPISVFRQLFIVFFLVVVIFKPKSKNKLSFKNGNKLEFRKYEYFGV